ncbi:glycosyltransferase family 4 protein [Streptomyces sp. A7024]|uniref:D-inositol 3-phosphate glycosyltransferase n=1 Tax=Streptomyces coryli TaxID=1128680 RepID=A0A6G4U578_9ACTN|nr:glycosyltransferase family 4 protein [Streptomyces coryli]NGN67334.1 glycosyltransferase family 4 protein [Streptomyces coryli]
MRISFLIHHAYGIGGTIRTTSTLARMLAEHHEVEIVSVFRHRDEPVFDPGPDVRLRALVDLRKDSPGYDGDDPLHAQPSRVFLRSDNPYKQYSRLTDRRIAEHLQTLDADVVVGTRPGLNVHIARQTRPGVVRVGQEHLTFDVHPWQMKLALSALYPRLHAVVTMTEADARSYRNRLRLPGVRLDAIPNGVPEPPCAPSDLEAKWVVAAGRLAYVKRYDVLVRAFEKVVAERPDWRLRIYGAGARRDRLRAEIEKRGLYNNVFLMGAAHPLEAEWPKGSIAVATSSMESFGMTLVEAMRCGLPVVSTDAPHGPREIITDGVDGLLVPRRSADAVADGLLTLIQDDELRHKMGRAALENSARFDPARIAERYDALFTELTGGPRSLTGRRFTGAVLGGVYAAKMAGRRLAA